MAAERVLTPLRQRLAPELGAATADALARFTTDVFGPAALRLGVRGGRDEALATRRRRARLLSILSGAAAPDTIVEACRQELDRHLASGRALPPGAEGIVLAIGAREGGARRQRALIAAARAADDPQARRRALGALAAFDDPAGLDRTLRASLDRRLAPAVDRALLLMQLLAERTSAEATWAHLRANWRRLESEMPPILLGRLVGESARALPARRVPEVRRFFARHPLAAGERVLRQIDEEAAIARRLQAAAGEDLRAALAGRGPD